MARRAVQALLLLGLLGLLGPLQAQDQGFDLADALGDDEKKPTLPPKKPSDGDDFSLEDALGGGGHDEPASPNQPRPQPRPQPNPPGTSGGFSDTDLLDGTSGNDGHGGPDGGSHRNEGQESTYLESPPSFFSSWVQGTWDLEFPRAKFFIFSFRRTHHSRVDPGVRCANSQGVVPGIVGAVVVAVAGAISSFIAYQKKKLCFKENDAPLHPDTLQQPGAPQQPEMIKKWELS
ncbi:CD99 antigen [Sciurus carolinensis]|uniref:CD99 antigen n=1 Tax=Sciurus carolinensis TaxID=30640 RepID=A0AA41T233_SCICA|nr:CD99 antigen [Sciurus carolinensis]